MTGTVRSARLGEAGRVGEDGDGSGGHGVGDEARAVHVEARQGRIQVAREHGSAVERDPCHDGVDAGSGGHLGPDPGRQVAEVHTRRGGSKGEGDTSSQLTGHPASPAHC